ncbi:MAG: deoxynucleoside kinase [Deltaproteobacteria bacterium]|nr:MAG: deoxynucleoside kinase [Deltaproteobacteria bacterium]
MSASRQLPNYIAVEGPIGVGKTTLVTRLAQRFDAKVVLEVVEENPFLPDFYRDPEKYAFQTQLFFLLSRYRQQQQMWQRELFQRFVLADYIFQKDRLFASLTLSDNEMLLYDQVFNILDTRVLKPDLVVFLQARLEVLLERISRRGRPFERNIDPEYLRRLSEAYNEYFFNYSDTPLLVVDTSDINIVENQQDFDELTRCILNHRGGIQYYHPSTT